MQPHLCSQAREVRGVCVTLTRLPSWCTGRWELAAGGANFCLVMLLKVQRWQGYITQLRRTMQEAMSHLRVRFWCGDFLASNPTSLICSVDPGCYLASICYREGLM